MRFWGSFFISIVCYLVPNIIYAGNADTLYVTSKQADSLFISQNLSLLASKYNIDINQVLVKQQKIWDNPSFSAELNLYNPSIRRWFDVGANGQKIFSVEQVIKIAGQRNKAAKWAQENVHISEYEFLDLIRNIKFTLHQNLYSLYFNRRTIDTYTRQLSLLDTIIKAYDIQFQKGNIPLKEVLRLKAIYYQLNNDRTILLNQVIEGENTLKILLGTTLPVVPVVNETELRRFDKNTVNINEVLQKALENRPDLRISSSAYNQSLINLEWQKRQGVPDLRLGGVYDQAGSYINNYSGITLGIDLPFFNRNQSNVKIAKFQIIQSEYAMKNDSIVVAAQVSAAWNKILSAENEYQKIDTDFSVQFDLINKGITENFAKRNISLLEFVDLFETYNETINQLNAMQINRVLAYEELNYSVGVELFR